MGIVGNGRDTARPVSPDMESVMELGILISAAAVVATILLILRGED